MIEHALFEPLVYHTDYIGLATADDLSHGYVGEDVTDNVLQNLHVLEDQLGQVLVKDGLEYDELVEQVLTLNDPLRRTT